ncbi:MAG: matrixin family metalloprotease [Alphaproteobacteria bacterium]
MRAYNFTTILVAAVIAATLWPGTNAFALDNFRLLEKFGKQVKWGDPAIGSGAKVTYAYVVKPVEHPATLNCSRMTSLDGLLATSGISADVLREEVNAAFAAWENAANISFVETEDQATAQIQIGAQSTPRRFAFANVDSSEAQGAGIGTIHRSLICLNPLIKWKVGFDGDLTVYDLRYTFIHEIGHAIGLDHAGASGQMMSFTYRESFRDLQPGDISGIEALYGARPEKIDLAASDTAPSPAPVEQSPHTAVRP